METTAYKDFPPSLLEAYEPVSQLGSGGMGTVFKVKDRSLGRLVALKLLNAGTTDANSLNRFVREALNLAKFKHPGIVRILDADLAGQVPYLLMELLEGEGLDHRLQRSRYDGPSAVQLLEALLETLGYVHDRGLIHRDIKPSNIFLRSQNPVLIDFGLATATERTRVTEAGTVLGTARYMAPELLRGSEHTPASDIFATALVGLELLESVDIHSGLQDQRVGNLPMILSSLASGAYYETARQVLSRHGDLGKTLLTGLSPDPADRPGHATDLLQSIRKGIQPQSTSRAGRSFRGSSPDAATQALVLQRSGRPRYRWPFLIVVTAIFIAILTFTYRSRREFTPASKIENTRPIGNSGSKATVPVVRPVNTVLDFDCVPTDRAVLIDFNVKPADGVTVELGRLKSHQMEYMQKSKVGAPFFHHLFEGLEPGSRYFARVLDSKGNSILSDYPFKTLAGEHTARVQDAIKQVQKAGDLVFVDVTYMGRYPDYRTIPALKRYFQSYDPVTLDTIDTIPQIGEKLRDPGLVDAMISAIPRLHNPRVIAAILRAAALSRHPQAESLARGMLALPVSDAVQVACVKALGTVAGDDSCDRLAKMFKQFGHGKDATRVAMVLASRSRAREHFMKWIRLPFRQPLEDIWNSMLGLAQLGEAIDVQFLREELEHAPSEERRALAAQALSRVADRTGGPALMYALDHQPPTPSLLWAVARMRLPEAVGRLREILNSDAPHDVIRATICALGFLRDQGSLVDFRRLALDNRIYIAGAAAWILGEMGDREAAPLLLKLVATERDPLGCATLALGRIPYPPALPILRQLVAMRSTREKSNDPVRRACAAIALGQLKDATAAPLLERLVTDPAVTVGEHGCARAAQALLGFRTGQEFFILPPVVLLAPVGSALAAGDSIDVKSCGYLTGKSLHDNLTAADGSVSEFQLSLDLGGQRQNLTVQTDGDQLGDEFLPEDREMVEAQSDLVVAIHAEAELRLATDQIAGDIAGFGLFRIDRYRDRHPPARSHPGSGIPTAP